MRIGRNDPCWCGSGVKFKHCHLGREAQPRIDPWQSAETMKGHFSEELCLHPLAGNQSCRGGIVKAHTIRRGADLSRIAKNGHVYGVTGHFRDVVSILRRNGPWVSQEDSPLGSGLG